LRENAKIYLVGYKMANNFLVCLILAANTMAADAMANEPA
jgi:hypothetical protein